MYDFHVYLVGVCGVVVLLVWILDFVLRVWRVGLCLGCLLR